MLVHLCLYLRKLLCNERIVIPIIINKCNAIYVNLCLLELFIPYELESMNSLDDHYKLKLLLLSLLLLLFVYRSWTLANINKTFCFSSINQQEQRHEGKQLSKFSFRRWPYSYIRRCDRLGPRLGLGMHSMDSTSSGLQSRESGFVVILRRRRLRCRRIQRSRLERFRRLLLLIFAPPL